MKLNVEVTRRGTYTAQISYYEETLNKEVNMYLCSKIDPVKEAERWAQNAYQEEVQDFFVYGIGFGYHIEALCKLLQPTQRVYVLESNLELNEALCQYSKQLLSHKQCEYYITDRLEEIKAILGKLQTNTKLVMYWPCVKLMPNHLNWLKHRFEQLNIQKNDDVFVSLIEENYKYNNSLVCENVSYWYEKLKGKSIVIVSGGPSLDKNIQWLKEVNEKAFIFSTGRTLKRLLDEKIRVDMFCIIDSQKEWTYKQIEGVEDLDIPFVFLNTVSHYTASAYKGPKYRAYSEDSPKEQEGRIESGGSVATAMLDLAIRFGGEPIIFVGHDLAYTNQKSHCDNEISQESVEEENAKYMKQVRSMDGSYIPTTPALLSYKYWIEQKIARTRGIRFINATEGGAFIEGCEHKRLQDTLKELGIIEN